MLCPAHMLGYLSAIPLARTGASRGVRRLAAAVCRPGLPGRASRTNLETQSPDWPLCLRGGVALYARQTYLATCPPLSLCEQAPPAVEEPLFDLAPTARLATSRFSSLIG